MLWFNELAAAQMMAKVRNETQQEIKNTKILNSKCKVKKEFTNVS